MNWKTLLAAAVAAPLAVSAAVAAEPAESLITPDNHTLLLIDHQPQMAFATASIDVSELRNNTVGLAKAAALFDVPTILTTVAAKSSPARSSPRSRRSFRSRSRLTAAHAPRTG